MHGESKASMEQQQRRTDHWGMTGTLDAYRITRYDEQRILVVNEQAERFTRTEYTILMCLLEEQMISTQRVLSLFGADPSDKTMQKSLERPIRNLRDKLRPLGLCLHRVNKCGYLLLPCPLHSQR